MQRAITRALALAATGLLGLAACQPIPGGELPGGGVLPGAGSGGSDGGNPTWAVIGGDEFDGTTVDPSKWKQYHNTYGDGNAELACLTPGNVEESAGTLKITSRKETKTCPHNRTRQYTSGFLGSRETGTYYPMYGKFEIRAKVPHAQGMWPAFWLRHRNGAGVAEVDVLEYFHARRPGQGSAALHLDGRKNVLQKHVDFEPSDGFSGWHTWGVVISPTDDGPRFEFFMDDRSYGSYIDTQHDWANVDPDATWDMAINQAVGGNWTGEPDGTLGYLPNLNRCSIGGAAPNGCVTDGIQRIDWSDPADTTYEVDWVRVSTLDAGADDEVDVVSDEKVVDFGSDWAWWYEDDAPAAGWKNPVYDTNGWQVGSGELGFGDDVTSTIISTDPTPRPLTAYFRSSVDIAEPERYPTYAVDLVANAGAVIYVNGTEVARENMRPGPVDHGTYAPSAPWTANRHEVVRYEIPASAFTAGSNTIAVEVHNNWRSQPSMGFDLALTGLAP